MGYGSEKSPMDERVNFTFFIHPVYYVYIKRERQKEPGYSERQTDKETETER